jgi:hypothetical protein
MYYLCQNIPLIDHISCDQSKGHFDRTPILCINFIKMQILQFLIRYFINAIFAIFV